MDADSRGWENNRTDACPRIARACLLTSVCQSLGPASLIPASCLPSICVYRCPFAVPLGSICLRVHSWLNRLEILFVPIRRIRGSTPAWNVVRSAARVASRPRSPRRSRACRTANRRVFPACSCCRTSGAPSSAAPSVPPSAPACGRQTKCAGRIGTRHGRILPAWKSRPNRRLDVRFGGGRVLISVEYFHHLPVPGLDRGGRSRSSALPGGASHSVPTHLSPHRDLVGAARRGDGTIRRDR